MRFFFKIIIVTFACVLLFMPDAFAVNKYAHPKKYEPPVSNADIEVSKEIEPDKPLEAPVPREPCLKNEKACRIDANIDEFQRNVSELADSYRSGHVWEESADTRITKDTKYKVPKYILKVPSYIMRGITWPVAIAADGLLKTGVVDKVVGVVSNKDGTFWVYPKVEMGFGTGFGGGIGVRHFDLFHKKIEMSAYYQIHINMNQETGISFKKPDAFYFRDHPFSYKVFARYFIHHDINYYGIGITAPRSNAATYNTDSLEIGGWFGYNITDRIVARAHAGYMWNSARDGSNGANKVGAMFPSSELIGYNRDTDYFVFGLSLTDDDRDNTVAPNRGGLRRIVFGRYQGLTSTNYDFNVYGIEAVQYLPVLIPRHVLVLRAAGQYQQQTDSSGIPFYMLTKLDVNAPMRGFPYGRFSDRGSGVFNVEYRFPIWKFLDGQFFFDTGRVFHEMTDISFKHFKYTGGGGLRVHTKNYFLIRLQAGYGGEGVRFIIKTTQEF